MKLIFKKANKAPLILILGICMLSIPYLFFTRTKMIDKGQYIWFIYFELLFLFTIFFLWYKIYYEIIFAKIENGKLYYKRLFFLEKTIKIEDIKGFKIGNEDYEFFVLYNKNEKRLFVIRTDFYSNFDDFIDELHVKNLGIYHTVFQKLVGKIFKKKW
ncbi:hypothetical protein ABEG63_13820 [Chryseobacterium sp. C39-AII1]|uniref:hypothetical protein n=1 Tax=Chryseobacterium sp. C39-AII1 TaxID=3080332 RepID=UPI00320A650B